MISTRLLVFVLLVVPLVSACGKSDPKEDRDGLPVSITVDPKHKINKKISISASQWLNGQPQRCDGSLTLPAGGSAVTYMPFETAFIKKTYVPDTTKVAVTIWKDRETLIGEVDFLWGDLKKSGTENVAQITLLDEGYEVERKGKKSRYRYYTKL